MSQLKLSFFIALRFLFQARQNKPLTLFTIVCVFGIALSVMIFLLIDTVMNGFSLRLQKTLMGFDAPLNLEVPGGQAQDAIEHVESFFQKHPHWKMDYAHGMEFYGLIQEGEENPLGVKVRGIGQDFFKVRQDGIQIYWQNGFDLGSFLQSNNAILIGEELFKSLPFFYSDELQVKLIHPFADLGPSGELEPQSKMYEVAGILATGQYDIDSLYVFVPSQSLIGFANTALNSHVFFFFPLDQSPKALKEIVHDWRRFALDQEYHLQSWMEKNQALFRAMSLEKIVFLMLFVLLVVISCLNLASLIRIFGMSQLKDMAVFRSLGASCGLLRQIYINIGAVLGGLGGLLGIGGALLTITFVATQDYILPQAYGFSQLPLKINPWTVIFLMIVAPFFSAFVALWPARHIVRESIVKVLKED